MTLRALINQLIDARLPVQVVPATVISVDLSAGSCTVSTADGLELDEVRLRAVLGSDLGVILQPKKESKVLIARVANAEADCFVVATTELEAIHLKIEQDAWKLSEGSVEGKAGTLTFALGDNGLKLEAQQENLSSLISELFDAIAQLTVTTSTGPSGVPINAPAFAALKQRFTTLITA